MNIVEKIKTHFNELKKYGSPLYVYDYDILKDRCRQLKEFQDTLENDLDNILVKIYYSPKANNNPAILKIVKDYGFFVDCMSPLELSINQKCRFNHNEILYVCNNIDQEEMRLVHDSNILICLDSISQVELWGQLFPNSNIMVRINPGVEGVGHHEKVITSGIDTKFGICEENIPLLLEVVEKYNLTIVGVHQHLGSLFLNDKIEDYIYGICEGLRIIKEHFKGVSLVDLGGGFGVPYKSYEEPLDFHVLESKLKDILNDFKREYSSVKKITFEIGRFIPCEAGILMGRVNAIKKSANTYWIGTDIGMNELVRPSMYNAYHEISLLEEKNKTIKANICGNVCESGDVIGRDRIISLPQIGDIVLVHNAGAYGYSMASNYTGRERPAEVMLYDDSIQLIRKRDTISSMEENIVW